MRERDISGQYFGRLKAVETTKKYVGSTRKWLCQCRCGNVVLVRKDRLVLGKTKSCGCLKKDLIRGRFKTHGMSCSDEYRIHKNMKARCLNPNDKDYKNYGARGIKVCSEWLKFENFYKDMGERPSKDHSIDRIDNDGDYCSENCRWATRKQQARNCRNSRIITYKGETNCISYFAEKYEINYHTLYGRIFTRGLSVKEAISGATNVR